MSKRLVLAYSGGLDTSVALHWLAARHGYQVVVFCADVGQGEDLRAVRAKALRLGAVRAIVKDLKAEFVRDYLFPILRANAVYEHGYLLGTAIARPLIAAHQMAIARTVKAEAVAHGATGKGNDQVRFELTYLALEPAIRVIAPWREWELRSRSDLLDYAKRHGIPVEATVDRPYSVDRNLFHVSYEGGVLEDPWQAPPEDLYTMTENPREAPDKPEEIEVTYQSGDPVAVNGTRLRPVALLERLNHLAGRHGVGRLDLVENRVVGIKSRGVYETPGGTVLHAAHRAVESVTMDRETLHLRDDLMPRYAALVYNGYWHTPERLMLQQAMDAAQRSVTGTARLRLYRGHAMVIGRKAPHGLYRRDLATFEAGHQGRGWTVRPRDAEGFIRLQALRLQTLHPTSRQTHRAGRNRMR